MSNDIKEIEEAILRPLYENWDTKADYKATKDKSNFDPLTVDKVWNKFIKDELIDKDTCRIAHPGVEYVEEQGFAPEELINEHRQIRTFILTFLAKLYDESGPEKTTDLKRITDKSGYDKDKVLNNLTLLCEYYLYVEMLDLGSYKITIDGYEDKDRWK